MRRLLLLGLGCAACAIEAPTESTPLAGRGPQPLVIETTGGLVQGTSEGDVRAFRGLPYAAPPVGPLRWHAPQPPAPWSGVRDASSFGPVCDIRRARFSEDCLYLNVYAPLTAPRRGLPVVVYLHGNGGTSVSPTGQRPTPPARIAARAVLVTVDWRAFTVTGVLDGPDLAAEDDGAGNFATLDLIAALEWVQGNIDRFGGDPDQVLVFGLSGGADYVAYLMASPLARGLFAAAAMDSPGWVDPQPPEVSESGSPALAAAVGCDAAPDPLACLRALPVEDLAFAPLPDRAGFGKIDGRVFVGSTFDVLREQGGVPLLIGSGREDAGFAVDPPDAPFTAADYEARIRANTAFLGPEVPDAVLALYPAAAYPTPRDAMVAVSSDALVTCWVREFALAAAGDRAGRPVWRWQYDHSLENDVELGKGGSFHTQFTHFALGDFGAVLGRDYAPTAAELALSEAIQDTLLHLARTGRPGRDGLEHQWPKYRTEREQLLVIDHEVRAGARYHVDECNFWRRYPF